MGRFAFLLRLFKKPKAVSVRAARLADADALAAIHREGGFAVAWTRAEFEQLLSDKAVIADVIGPSRGGNTVFGFILSRRAADEAEILTIAMRKAYRRSGYGTTLLRHHLSRLAALACHALFLEVEDGNAPARALYERRGFVEVGRRNAYYKKPDGSAASALVMRRGIGSL